MKEKIEPKRKLILLGNGFDKAHGLPTSYAEFISQYSKDETTNNDFAKKLIAKINRGIWSDIESFFYKELLYESQLKKFVELDEYKKSRNIKDVKRLNKEFESVKLALENYLVNYVENKYIFKPKKEFINIFKGNKDTDSILLLNFNYTKTAEMYLSSLKKYNPQLINIHGKLNEDEENPMIFGFGDEYDKLYKVIEEYNDNSLFQHIKSFGYVKTNNYHKMESFVETEPYEIYIIGHSCGLSDRTLLKYLFEHDHCSSIKIFYYEKEKGNTKKSRDNHNYTAQEISRHFEDKAKMRSRIISFEDSVPCPQTPLEKKGK